MNERLTHIDLFAGIGGFSLASRQAGFRTIAFCEIDPFCQAVLRKHWPDVPIHEDVNTFPSPWGLDKNDVMCYTGLCETKNSDKRTCKIFGKQCNRLIKNESRSSVCNAEKKQVLHQALLSGIEEENTALGNVEQSICGANTEPTLAAVRGCSEREIQTIKMVVDTKGTSGIKWQKSINGAGACMQGIITPANNADIKPPDTIPSTPITSSLGQKTNRCDSKHQTESRYADHATKNCIRKTRTVDLLTAGIPCQPASCAGKRRGSEDHRWLWPRTLEVISAYHPRWVILENVSGFISLQSGVEFERVLLALESEGYSVRTFIIPACATDAKHRRDRCWIVAHSEQFGRRGRRDGDAGGNDGQVQTAGSCPADQCEDVADDEFQQWNRRSNRACRRKRESPETLRYAGKERGQEDGVRQPQSNLGVMAPGLPPGLAGWCEWPEEPSKVPRVAVGVKERVNQLKALGNSIVPQVAFEIINAIAQITNLTDNSSKPTGGHHDRQRGA